MSNVKPVLHASPTKDFFVKMITKDIHLIDCILDLLDNCVDGANRALSANSTKLSNSRYEGFKAKIRITAKEFIIEDNCGGIPLSEAIDYAFHFGRRSDAPPLGDHSIGLYGIGMKRAILKIGNKIRVESCNGKDCFGTSIDVTHWLKSKEWDFDLDSIARFEPDGTKLVISDIYPQIAEEFASGVFINQLSRIVARDYSFIIEQGFEVVINGETINPFEFKLLSSPDFSPIRSSTSDGNVKIEIIAGLAAPPPDDLDPDWQVKPNEYYGWFVICNDRVVLAADKTDRTVWGTDDIPRYHTQFYGFMGLAIFTSKDPNLLPWTTTKREVDLNDPIYKRAVVRMKNATREFINYTNDRKNNLDFAKQKEAIAQPVYIRNIATQSRMTLPKVSQVNGERISNVHYQRPEYEIRQVAKALGNPRMTNREVGIKTFEYFRDNELDE